MSNSGELEIPVMVATSRPPSKPKFMCRLVNKKKSLLKVFHETEENETQVDNDPDFKPATVKVSSSETGEQFPFHAKITIDQACRMLRSDILWINYELATQRVVPPPNVRNALEFFF